MVDVKHSSPEDQNPGKENPESRVEPHVGPGMFAVQGRPSGRSRLCLLRDRTGGDTWEFFLALLNENCV